MCLKPRRETSRVRREMRSPARLCAYRGDRYCTTSKKRVRINPVVERTTLLPRCRYTSDESYCSSGRRRRRTVDSSRSPSPILETRSRQGRGRAASSSRSGSHHHTSRRYSPPPTNRSRMRSPQKDRPLYDDDDDYLPSRDPRIRRASAGRRSMPIYDNNKVLFHRRNHYFARGDALTHKNLTRTYVFHRQPFDWYDTTQGLVLEDIEQILDPDDPYDNDEPLGPTQPSYPASSRHQPFEPTTYYEQAPRSSSRSRSRSRSANRSGFSAHFYDDIYSSSQHDLNASVKAPTPTIKTPSPKRSPTPPPPEFIHRESPSIIQPSAFRPPSTNTTKQPTTNFYVEKQSSKPTPSAFSAEFIVPRRSSKDSTFLNAKTIDVRPPTNKPSNGGKTATTGGYTNDDIYRIMKKFDEIGITDDVAH